MVGVSAEVHVLRRAAEATGGSYGVALGEAHLGELLLAHAPPPPAPCGSLAAELVRMGFPTRAAGDASTAVFVGELPALLPGGYTCPRCKARTQELPCRCGRQGRRAGWAGWNAKAAACCRCLSLQGLHASVCCCRRRCHVCGLTLISSPHLARSYHHLFPVPAFEELDDKQLAAAEAAAAAAAAGGAGGGAGSGVSWYEPGGPPDSGGGLYCYGCVKLLGTGAEPGGGEASMVLRCRQCSQLFCYECDAFVHESLHNCPGCECGMAASSAPPHHDADGGAGAAANGAVNGSLG